jgi:hypothetical protein
MLSIALYSKGRVIDNDNCIEIRLVSVGGLFGVTTFCNGQRQ